jgi:tryptophan synthase alpha chain
MQSPPNRIDQTFGRLRQDGQKGFVAYIGAGDPDLARTLELALALEGAGVDILELGVPFSDPLADGAVNQAAAARALAAGTTVAGVLGCVRELRTRSAIPVVLYTYLNPVYSFGFERFLCAAAAAGVDGVLVLDLPPEEAGRNAELRSHPPALRMIRLIAPTTPPERIAQIAAAAEGFIYFVSREGVTGEQQTVSASLATPAQARETAAAADAVVVGSAIVRQVADFGGEPDLAARVAAFVRPMVAAVKKDFRQQA